MTVPPARKRPTMKDVARRAGVSESAVSFALNDRPGVSEGTRRRVRRVAEELGWQPNSAARALSGERSGSIGLVLNRPAATLGPDSFFLQLLSGVQQALAPRGAALLFQMVESADDEVALYRRWWAAHRVDGVIVVDPRTDDPRPALLTELGLPAVVVGGVPDEAPGLATISADDAGAMEAAVAHLAGLGHRRIVHIAGLPGLAHTERRIAALRDAAERYGLTEARSLTTDYSDTQGARATRAQLGRAQPPTAIIYDNDVMAVAGVNAATGRGLTVPDDLSVVAFEDSDLCRLMHPQLAALVRDSAAFGREATALLLARLDGAAPAHALAPTPRLTPRASTAT
ncbi:LacI family DNA-binding transcriptional regulator, partial [Mangrovactinospora gilvigrisea]|uniref:LacI family DNA-binding transcriptional regulator n=1 Tax=Mangrovactinospora gilvigrisea TaxID=1428644 RepID=UPI000A69C109